MADDKRPPTKNEMSRAEREAALWDDDIKLFKDEVAQQRSLPYVWAQDIRHLEIDFNVPWFIKRDDIRTEWTKYSIKCGVDTPAGFSTILEVRESSSF